MIFMKYYIHEPLCEDIHMSIHKKLSEIEELIHYCKKIVVGAIVRLQAELSYYLYTGRLEQSEYYEYYHQLLSSVTKFESRCVCYKK